MSDATIQGHSIPLDAITTIIEMITGQRPFNLLVAVKAGFAVAEYVIELLGGDHNAVSIQSASDGCCDDETKLLQALQYIKAEASGPGEVQAQGLINIPVQLMLEQLLKMLLQWLCSKTNS